MHGSIDGSAGRQVGKRADLDCASDEAAIGSDAGPGLQPPSIVWSGYPAPVKGSLLETAQG